MGSGASVLQQRSFRPPRAYVSVPRGAWIVYSVWAVECEVPYGAEYIGQAVREAEPDEPFGEPDNLWHILVWLHNSHGYRWLRIGGIRFDPRLQVDAYW